MTVACPHCGESLSFGAVRPKFCAYCGKPLDDSALVTTASIPPAFDPEQAETVAHTPAPRPPHSAPVSEPPPDRVGGYRLIKALGHGGMGTVYEAEEIDSGRKVALKLVSPEIVASREALQRFRQEGRLASTISHPRCVFVLKADEEEGRPFIVMELMPGTTLQDLVTNEGPMTVENAVVKILDVIEGLCEAHRLGVIHRDVKPSNCFLEANGRVKVGDFGLSKSLVMDSGLTRTGSFLGTPLYASPEQIKGDVLDPRADLYSVSATLYYLLAGRPPFQGSDAAATLAKIVSEPPTPLRQVRPDIPVELERIVLRGLERNRDRRYRDLSELREALLPFSPGRLPIGRLGLRLGAYLIDVVLLKFAIISLVTVGRYLFASGETGYTAIRQNMTLSAILDIGIFLVSFFIIEPRFGASPAKRMLRLRVRGEGTGTAHFATILKRNLIFWAVAALPWEALELSNALIGPFDWIAYVGGPVRIASLIAICSTMRASNGSRGLHEILSGTRVVGLPRAARRRSGESRRALGKDRSVAPRPIGVLTTVGPYRVRGAIRWEEGRKVLAAEDSTLGREAWVVIRARSSPSPDAARRNLDRETRPRWLSGGEQAEGRWDAYIAPSGCPLADLAGSEGLPWRDARPIIEDLADEVCAAIADGTLPDGLSIDQVWVQPDGRALLVDQLGVSSSSTTNNAVSAKQIAGGSAARTPAVRALDLLHRASALALEGGRRSLRDSTSEIRAAVPRHARAMLDRLGDGPKRSPAPEKFRQELRGCHDHEVEVRRVVRAASLGIVTILTFLGLSFQFLVAYEVLSGAFRDRPVPFLTGQPTLLGLRQAAKAIIGGFALAWVIGSFATRGGLSFALVGLALSRRDGRPAGRFRCAFRSLLVWLPSAVLLTLAVEFQGANWEARWPSWTLFGVALGVLALFPAIAMINPARGPHDRLAGTVVVPR